MGLFDLFKKQEAVPAVADDVVVAVATGELVPPSKISDPVFAEEMMGKTVAVEPTDGTIVAPANGTIEVAFPTGHAFGIRMADGTGLLVHIGIDTVAMKGDGFKVMKKVGDTVKAGETVVKVDLAKVEAAGHPKTTMIIFTELDEAKDATFAFGPVTKGQEVAKVVAK